MNDRIAQGWITLAGVVLIAVGLLGFVSNPLVGPGDALIPTGTVHNVVHVATGLLALYIALGMRGLAQANGVIGFGVLYVVIFVVVLLSPTLLGLFEFAANLYIHVIHAALAVVSLAVGYMARNALAGAGRTG
ncbi:MAG TPA: hypothetical protein VNL94_04655 [Candidatus Binatia bacterium]|nr:hypothetical protein [Candidatus Binatia bacterium]